MYNNKVVSLAEADFINKIRQKIASLGSILAEESIRNDITVEHINKIIVLSYVMEDLLNETLLWSFDDRQEIIDYLMVEYSLIEYPYFDLVTPIFSIINNSSFATINQINDIVLPINTQVNNNYTGLVAQINEVNQASLDRDSLLQPTLLSVGLNSTYPIGTPIHTVLLDIVNILFPPPVASVSNLVFPSYMDTQIETGTSFFLDQITWNTTGDAQNLVLNDSENILINEPVSNGSIIFNPTKNYNFSTSKTITWTLSGSNISPITKSISSFYPSYMGKKITGEDIVMSVTSSDILAGTIIPLQNTLNSVIVAMNTTNLEQGWIAVLKQGASYTSWYVDTLNSGPIGAGNFIESPIDVQVFSLTYSVYRYSYRSPLNNSLTLSV